jgi:hypothetical protein
VKSGKRKTGQGSGFGVRRTSGANWSVLVGGDRALVGIAEPNNSVKGTSRPLAVLEFGYLSRFGGFVSLSLAARPLP